MDALSTQIASRSFDTVKRGYDKSAVDAYLTRLGEQVGRLEDELRVARSRLEALEKQTKDVRDANTIVKTAFLAAAESKAKLIAEAEAAAAEILAAAERRAAGMAPGTGPGDAEAAAFLLEAKQRLEDAERHANARRKEAELEARAIIASARARVAETGAASSTEEATAAAEELQHLVDALAALKQAAGSLGLEGPDSETEATVAHRSGEDAKIV